MTSIRILLNGETRDIPAGFSAFDLISSLDLTDKRLALEVNREIVPRSQYQQTALHAGDTVEIVHAIGGG